MLRLRVPGLQRPVVGVSGLGLQLLRNGLCGAVHVALADGDVLRLLRHKGRVGQHVVGHCRFRWIL